MEIEQYLRSLCHDQPLRTIGNRNLALYRYINLSHTRFEVKKVASFPQPRDTVGNQSMTLLRVRRSQVSRRSQTLLCSSHRGKGMSCAPAMLHADFNKYGARLPAVLRDFLSLWRALLRPGVVPRLGVRTIFLLWVDTMFVRVPAALSC